MEHWTWIGEDNVVYTMNSGVVEKLESSDYAMVLNKSNMPDGSDIDTSNYYIVSKDLNHIYGPYSPREVPSFTMLQWVYNDRKDSPYFDSICLHYDIYTDYNFGIFYEKMDRGYVIHTTDGLQSSNRVYDSAKPISDSAMQVRRDGLMGVVNQYLDEVYLGEFEDCTDLIDGKGYIKKDGKWMYIQFEDVDSPIKAANYTTGTYVCDTDVPVCTSLLQTSENTEVMASGEIVEFIRIRAGLFDTVWGETSNHSMICIEDSQGVYLHKE